LKNIINKEIMDWKNKLRNAGYRITDAREQMMDLLINTQTALSPMQIHKALAEQGSQMGLVSVYRNLAVLQENDLVCIVFAPDGSAAYTAGGMGHHHHVLCRQCLNSASFEGCEGFADLIQEIEAQTQFKVQGHLLQFYGLCSECQKNEIHV